MIKALIFDCFGTCDIVKTYGMQSICYHDLVQCVTELEKLGVDI